MLHLFTAPFSINCGEYLYTRSRADRGNAVWPAGFEGNDQCKRGANDADRQDEAAAGWDCSLPTQEANLQVTWHMYTCFMNGLCCCCCCSRPAATAAAVFAAAAQKRNDMRVCSTAGPREGCGAGQ